LNNKSRQLVWLFTYASRVLAVVVGLSVIGVLFTARPETHITLEAGTEGGLFDVMVHELAGNLARYGIKTTVVNRPDSLRIVDDIANSKSKVDAGFIASDVPKSDYDTIQQLGTVMLAPVYLIAHKESNVTSITDFKNRTITLYPKDSAAWDACQYVLGNYGATPSPARTQYGNGKTIVENVTTGVTDVGCFIDVPSGANLEYAKTILNPLTNPNLRYIEIPQALALQARKDYLRPSTVPSGAFRVHPPRPDTDIETTSASITFVAKNNLPRELVIMISHKLAEQYRGSTSANQAGELPNTKYLNLPAFREATDIYSNGLPWLYRKFSYRTAGFLDKFFGRYGIVLTLLFIVLSFTSMFGLPSPYGLIVGTRPRRMLLIVEAIDRRTQQNGSLSRSDRRKLETIERWLNKESAGLDGLEDRLKSVRASHRSD
jgi:TRAP-type uncharacterized transport system substrate-binding protein